MDFMGSIDFTDGADSGTGEIEICWKQQGIKLRKS